MDVGFGSNDCQCRFMDAEITIIVSIVRRDADSEEGCQGRWDKECMRTLVLLSVAVNTDCSIQQCLLSKVLILYDSLCTALLERQNTVMKSRFC